MLADPQSITVATVAKSMPRTSAGVDSGAFTFTDGSYVLKVSHAYGRRTRRTIRIDNSKIAADPLTSNNVKYSSSCYIVFDEPATGYTRAEALDQVRALTDYLAASSYAVLPKWLGGES